MASCLSLDRTTRTHLRILKVTVFFFPFKYKRGKQRGAIYSRIKILNRLPPHTLKLKNETPRLRVALRKYLITHVFYSFDE
jgi:hypothetical protein